MISQIKTESARLSETSPGLWHLALGGLCGVFLCAHAKLKDAAPYLQARTSVSLRLFTRLWCSQTVVMMKIRRSHDSSVMLRTTIRDLRISSASNVDTQ